MLEDYVATAYNKPMTALIFNLALTILLEYAVLLLFFKRQWKPCLQFSILVNCFTLPLGTILHHELHFDWFLLEGLILTTEAVAIYFYWRTSLAKSIAASAIANILTAGLFPFLHWLGINAYPF